MSERRTFVPSGRYFIGMEYEIRIKNCSCRISQIDILSKIVSEELLNFHQCYLVWDISLGDEIQYVKLKV